MRHPLSGRYGTIVLDPPWPRSTSWKRVPAPWPTLTLPQIASLDVPRLLDDPGLVYVWTIDWFLPWTLNLVTKGWGLTRYGTLVWCKRTGLFPHGLQSNVEFCVLAYRGALSTLKERNKGQSPLGKWLLAKTPRGGGKKPPEAYQWYERFGFDPKLEVFAQQKRPGWTSVGYGVGTGNVMEVFPRRPIDAQTQGNDWLTGPVEGNGRRRKDH